MPIDLVNYEDKAREAVQAFWGNRERARQSRLIAALEFKSHVGPSFGNNFNNRTEEAIGTAHDVWTAYREGAFGEQPRPFVGWLIMVEDADSSRKPIKDVSPHFPIFCEFKGASYATRYTILCRKLMQEQLYTVVSQDVV